MAQVLRTRQALIVAAGVGAVALAVTCWPHPHDAATPRRVDTSAIDAAALVDAVLDECHKPLRGRMARITATVNCPSLGELQVFADLPSRARVQGAQGSYLVLQDEVLPLTAETAAPTAKDAARLRLLRQLLDAAAFGPLYRATQCRRAAADTFLLTAADGAGATLRLRPGTLLPAALGAGEREVRFVDYLRTTTTWIVSRAELDGLGVCSIRFDTSVHDWNADFFARPDDHRVRPSTQVMPAPGVSIESRSPTPMLVAGKAMHWCIVDDPGDWPGREAAYLPLHRELERQGQQIFGFPGFWQTGDHKLLGAPFRQREGGQAFAAPQGWNLLDVEPGRLLVVYPPGDDLAAKIATGTRLLQEALANYGLEARGAITMQPYLHLEEGLPDAAKLTNPTVRMSVPVR